MPKEKFDITGCKSTSRNPREVNMCKTCRKLRNLSGLQNGEQDYRNHTRRHEQQPKEHPFSINRDGVLIDKISKQGAGSTSFEL